MVVPNADMALRPGQFVKALVHIEDFEVPLAVRVPAVQRYLDADAVFVKNGEDLRGSNRATRPARRRTRRSTRRLDAGETYVVENSYVIKADLEKAGAAHAH